jgi:hypothetical protein
MATFKVPANLTLHEAVHEAAASQDAENFIDIGDAVVHTAAAVDLGNEFDAARKLTIRPDPTISGLKRAAIVSGNPSVPIVTAGAGHVTMQDLDILRNITNNNDLVVLSSCDNFTIERCRIGSIWPSTGTAGWANLRISSPTNIIVRNSIFFARQPNTFDYGIRIQLATGLAHSLLLYNNVVADYREYGIHATVAGGDAFLLLRNNVVANHPGGDPEAMAYYTAVADTVAVATSHNAAFAGVDRVEEIGVGCQSISGAPDAGFLRFARAQVAAAFVEDRWNRDPLENPNADFFRLVNGGPLHNAPEDAGQNVRDHLPHARDVRVTDDIEQHVRPAGIPLHTDRGADQIRKDDLLVNLGSLTLNPSVLPGCRACSAALTLNAPAVGTGAEVDLAADGPATLPSKVTIPAGARTIGFSVETTPVAVVRTAKIVANYRGVRKAASLTVRPIGVQSLKLAPSVVQGGGETSATIVLECTAQPADIQVAVASTNPAVIVPTSVVVGKGSISAAVPIRTKHVSAMVSVTITASANGGQRTATLTVKP